MEEPSHREDDGLASVSPPAGLSIRVAASSKRVFDSIVSVPKIHFCADSSTSLEEFHRAGPDVLSVDWRFPISDVWRRCGDEAGAQGNLDPAAAVAGGAGMERRVSDILRLAKGHEGHIFSLGHGVLRETNPDNLKKVVRIVHESTRRPN